MKEKEGPPLLTVLTILLISGGWTEGSPHGVISLRSSLAPLNSCPAFPISLNYCLSVSRPDLNSTLDEPCSFTLPQYACSFVGQVSNLTSGELASILQCSITNPTAQPDQAAFLLLFKSVEIHTLQAALDKISVQIPRDQISPASRAFLLNAAWEKLSTDPQVWSAGFLAAWFQETLHSYLTAVNINVLDCMTQLPITCDGFATVVQALDSVYSGMDNSTRQLVANWIGRFLIIYRCQQNSAKEWIHRNWKSFLNYASYNDLKKTWSGFDGFAALDVLTASQLAQLTVEHRVLSNISLTEVVAQALSSQDVLYTEGYLNELARLPLEPSFDREAAYLMLETILTQVNQSFPDLCSPSLKDLFQVKLTRLLPFAEAKTLTLFPTQIGCTDFHDIYKGINSVYLELDLTTQMAVFQNRLNFLEGQLAKEGSACMFTTSNSREWLQENFGYSSSFADYKDFIRLNPSFKGFEVLDLLTVTQIGTLVVTSGILTNNTSVSAETEATTVIASLSGRNISELQTFLLEVNKLAEQSNMVEITNVKVRVIMLEGIFNILKPHFASPLITDLGSWFNGLLSLYLPSITPELLDALPSLSNSTQLQDIVKGLDAAFDPMSPETKTGVAQWIFRVLRKIGFVTTNNWPSLYFQRFKSLVSITDLMALDPSFNGTAHLEELSAIQLAQLTVTEEVLSSVHKVEMVFARLAQLSSLDELVAYWDEFNIAYEKPSFVKPLNISMTVKALMLSKTMERLRWAFSTFTDVDYDLWFGKRLVVVLPSVTGAILQQIPINMSCGAYKSLIAGINRGFSEIPPERRMDVFNYIVSFVTQKSQTTGPACSRQTTTRNWLLNFFGRFSMEAPYLQLVSYYDQTFDAYSVLDLLTPGQIGNMMVHSNTLTSMDLAMRLVTFFQESTVDYVQMILKEFTKAAIKHKMAALPSAEVAHFLLKSYLDLASSQMETYTAAEWNATFQGELRFLSFMVNTTTLASIVPQNYDSFTAIVAGLSGAHSHMAESSRRAVVLWIMQNLKTLKGHPMKPVAEWIWPAWGLFFHDATLEEVKSTNENFKPFSVLSSLSIGQLIDFVMTSDAMVNMTTMNHILLSLGPGHSEIPLAKMAEFLTGFNLAIEQKNIPGIRNAKVRLEMLNTVFTNLASYFYKFTALDYQTWFSKNLKFLLPSINKELLQLIPLDIGFPAYSAIFGGLDQVYPQLPLKTSLHIYELMKTIVELKLNVSETAFLGTYNSSQSFLQLIFYRFVRFAPYADLLALYKDFNGYEVLSLLSPKQMGEMIVLTNAFKDELRAVQILVELEKRPAAEMMEFIIAFNAVAEQKRLTILPDLRIRDLIFKTVFKTLKFSSFSAEQYTFWFGAQLRLLLPSLTPKDLQLIPLDVDCQSHQNLVKAMDNVFNHFTERQKRTVHERILSYLQSYRMEQGETCSPNANSSQWLLSSYGRFGVFGSIAEFSSVNLNFNGISAMAELSASQLAELAVELGALADGSSILDILGNLDTVLGIGEFLDKLNAVAAVELQSSEFAGSILSIAFQRLRFDFPRFKAGDFTYWFQVAFQNVLHAVNETLVAKIPLNIPCNSYRQILKGFNNVFANIPAQIAPSIFGFSKAFLTSKTKSGLACGEPTQSVQHWLQVNLGNFTRYAQYQDLLSWNLHFDGMAVLEYLSPSQLASLTLESDAIDEDEKMCQILARLLDKPLEEIYQYLDQFNAEAQKLAITSLKEEGIRRRMLSQFLEDLASGFSTFSPGNWTHLLSTRLVLFLPSVSAKETTEILSYVSGCKSFRAVVSSLSQVYPAMLPANQNSVYRTLFTFLDNQRKTAGSACASNPKGSEAWLLDNLGAFSGQAPYEDFTTLLANFDGFDVRDNLTSTQLAHVFFGSGILDDADVVSALLAPLEDRPLDDMVAFVTEFATVASQSGITFLANTEVRDVMFEAIFIKVQSVLTTANLSQYKDWFQNKLNLWLPSISASALAAIPKTIPCGIFKAIIAGLDANFQRMSPGSRQDVYNFAKDYLTTKVSQGGDPCTENTRGSLGWLHANFGSFSSLANYKDLVGLNVDFRAMDAMAGLTPSQLAEYTLASDVLRDSEKAGKVFGSLNAHNVGGFMDAFNAGAQQHHLTQLPHLETKQFILSKIFYHLSGLFQHFTAEDYAGWFGPQLHFFLGNLDAQNLGFLPNDMPCDSLAAIVKALNDHHANSTFEKPEDILSFIKRVLHFQLQNSGSACTQGISTDRQWLTEFFGPLTAYGSYSDFTTLKGNFRGDDSLDLLSASALAHLSTQSHNVYSSSAMTLVFQAIGRKAEPNQFLSAYLDEFNSLVLKNRGLLSNTKVRDTMLTLSAEILFPQIAAISLEDTTTWFQKLGLLLPGINETVLELLPSGMPCPYYQAIVKAFDGIYSTLSARKRQAVYGFQKAYLAAQFADSGSACDGETAGIRDWLMKNLGQFCSVAQLSELQAFNPDLDGMENPLNLSPAKAADLTIMAQMLHNSTLANLAVGLIKNFENYDSLREYLSRLRDASCQSTTCNRPSPSAAALTPETQQELLDNALFFLKRKGSSMNSTQWAEAYHLLLSNFLPALDTASNATCDTFNAAKKKIIALQSSLIDGPGELEDVNSLCTLGNHQPNPIAPTQIPERTTDHIPGAATQDVRGSTPNHIPELATGHTSAGSTSHVPGVPAATQTPGRAATTLDIPESSEVGTPGHVTIHSARNTTSGFPGNAVSQAPGGATRDLPGSGTTRIAGDMTSMQDIPGNTTGEFPGSPRTATGDLHGGATTLGPGDVSGSAATDTPGGTTGSIRAGTASYLFGSATSLISGNSATHTPGGSVGEVSGGAATQMPGSTTFHILGGANQGTPGDATVGISRGTGSHLPGGATTHFLGKDISGVAATGIPGTHVPVVADHSIPAGAGNSIPTGHISAGATGKIPGGATGHTTEGTTGKIPGGATGHIPGATTTHLPEGTTSKIPGGATGHIPGGATGHITAGTAGKIPGGATDKIPGGATGHIPGGTTGKIPGSTTGHIPGGATDKIPGGATDKIPGGATGHIPGGTTGKIPGSTTGHIPGGATDKIPGGATGHIPGGATRKIPGSTTGHIPGAATTHLPTSTTGKIPGGATGHFPGGATGHIPGSATTHIPGGTTGHIPGNIPDVSVTHIPVVVDHNIPAGAGNSLSAAPTSHLPGNATGYIPGGATTYTRNCPFLFLYCILLPWLLVTFSS